MLRELHTAMNDLADYDWTEEFFASRIAQLLLIGRIVRVGEKFAVPGLRKTLARKGKAFAIFELVQNAYDEDATEVSVTLTQPQDGRSMLTCVDDASKGYRDLSTAHTM